MIDHSLFHIEDFLVDNTFQLYCAGKDKRCIAYWENYIKAHPEQASTINEAKRLYSILSGHKKPLNSQLELLKNSIKTEQQDIVVPFRRSYTWLKIAAAIFLISGIVLLYRNYYEQVKPTVNGLSAYRTNGAEHKKITLPDGTLVLLNAKSSLQLGEDFNTDDRTVTLIGEAFFDVKHNKDKPFKVHTSDFDIHVLGTTFNVKVYPGDPTSEAVLIKGLIIMKGAGSKGNSITLKPSQKVTFYKNQVAVNTGKLTRSATKDPEITINRYTKINDSTIVEMAWTENRLEIVDQDFSALKNVLERWYDVDIKFTDHEIEKYRFTATFNKETIVEVLNALQSAQHFKYEIKGNQVIISK
jgi:transmembrane sensor